MQGWIKSHRAMLENPVVCKDSDHIAVWMYLLLKATHKEYSAIFCGEKITLYPGQLITGRKVIAEKFKISESKVQRVLKLFESEQQIEQQNGNKNRLITVVTWSDYQNDEQQIEQQLNNNRTTTEQQLNTNKNVKNKENVKNDNKDIKPLSDKSNIAYVEIIDYLNEKAGTKFKGSTASTQKHIKARWNEKFTLDDFKSVIDIKVNEWQGTSMDKYIRPETLFGTKFEGYLNEKGMMNNGKHGGYPQANASEGRESPYAFLDENKKRTSTVDDDPTIF